MANLLYITNIAGKRMSYGFVGSAIEAAKSLELAFYTVANRSLSKPEDIKADEEEYGVHLLHIPMSRSPFSIQNRKVYKQLCQIIRENKIDYIHCNTPVGGILGRLAGKKCGVKRVIYHVHGFHFYKGAPKLNWLLYYPVEKWLARYTDALITINRDDYELAQKFKFRNNGKIYYMPGVGVDLTTFQADEDSRNAVRSAKRTELGFDEDDIIMMSVGRLDANKNNANLLSAINKCNNPKLHLVICGDGEQREALIRRARELNMENQLHLLGLRTDMVDLYKAADVFVIGSYREGLSRSLMEAMASGLPVACSRIRGNVDLVDEGKGGVLFNPASVTEIAAQMNKLLASDMKGMSEYNLEKIKGFSLDVAIEKMQEIYTAEFINK